MSKELIGGGNLRTVQYIHFSTKKVITALFHQWGQHADGEGNSNPVAIVELPDGRVDTIYAGNITFLDKPKEQG